MTLFLLYLWLKLDNIVVLLSIMSAASVIGWIGCSIEVSNNDTDKLREFEKSAVIKKQIFWISWRKRCFISFFPLMLLAVFLPSKQDAAYIAGGYFAIEAAHSPEASKIASILRVKVNKYLDEEVEKQKAVAIAAVASAVSK